jgi:hypothetical protein
MPVMEAGRRRSVRADASRAIIPIYESSYDLVSVTTVF